MNNLPEKLSFHLHNMVNWMNWLTPTVHPGHSSHQRYLKTVAL